MNNFIKTHDEIGKMRVAGKLASDVLMMIKDFVKPGVTTGELDTICHNYIVDVQDAIPAPLNFIKAFQSPFVLRLTIRYVTAYHLILKN